MSIKNLTANFGVCAALIGLTACQTTVNSTSTEAAPEPAGYRSEFRSEIPPELYQTAVSIGFAQEIAKACPSIGFRTEAVQQAQKSAEEDLFAKGYRESDLDFFGRHLPKARLQADLFDYIEKSGIIVGERKTFCAAGQREIANQSSIGTFLKAN